MITEGGLGLEIAWNGKQVTGAAIRSTRPLRVSRVLEGRPADQALAMVPLLFSVCGRSQTVAAALAVGAAAGSEASAPVARLRELAVAAECAHEHLWRLLLDLPPLLGAPPLQELFVAMRRRFDDLRRLVVSRGAWWDGANDNRDLRGWRALAGDLTDLLAADVLGMEPARFVGMASPGELADWLSAGKGVAARQLAALWDLPLGRSGVPLLALPTADGLAEIAGALEACDDFTAAPARGGVPMETGALAREADHLLLAALRAERGNTVGVRLLARLLDLARLAERMVELSHGGPVPPWMRAARLRPGTGVAAVETARGVLIHLVGLEGGKVARWRILAPTEWNFHAEGAFARGLAGYEAADEAAVKRAAGLLAHALDPCVAYGVVVKHA